MHNITFHKHDLPTDLNLGSVVAVDTETMGLVHRRDPLCVVQIAGEDGHAHVVQLDRSTYDAPHLKLIFEDSSITKIFHFARFDLAAIKLHLGVTCTPVYCTRTASKIARTYTDRHGLRDNCKELLGIDLNKKQQSSDWGAAELTSEQIEYAASDVFYLHELKEKLDIMLEREGRVHLAQSCFDFLPARADLDLAGWLDIDIFSH